MKNEEIKGLIDKKAYEDQLSCFFLNLSRCKLFVSSSLELSHYSLSLSHSWSIRVFLEHSSFGSRKEKKEKVKEGKRGSRKETRIRQL